MKSRTLTAVLVLALAIAAATAAQVSPPEAINYQGVLRDAAGAPLTGAYDMTFRLFDAVSGGNEVLVDTHVAAGTGAVTVTGGLFNAEVGSGALADGSGPGTYNTLGAVFSGYTHLYLEVQVGAETLAPRIHLASAGSALNAGTAVTASTAYDAQNLGGFGASMYTKGASAETILGNWVNTTNPWADNEVSDTLTVGSTSTITLSTVSSPTEGRIYWDPAGDDIVVGSGTGSVYFYGGPHAAAASEGGAATSAADLNCANCIGGTEIDESALGTVPVATALAADPTGCSAGNVVVDIAANGTLTCVPDDDTPDSDAEVPDTITVGSGGAVYLSTITLNTTPSTMSGRLSYDATNDALAVGDGTVTDYFYSSTFNDTRYLRKDASDSGTGLYTFTGTPTGAGVGAGTLYLNPASASANYTLFSAAVGGAQRFRIDAEGDGTFSGGLSVGSGLNLSGGTAGAANTVDFGNGTNDDLTATDVIDLTDGGATTLHTHDITGAGDARYLRKDVADTAAGDITFSSGHIGVGVAPASYAGINQSLTISSLVASAGINASLTNSSSGTTVYGAEIRGNSSGATNNNNTFGARAYAEGAADSTGPHYGMYGSAAGGNGAHYGLYGIATQTATSGTHYGVYGTASGGATNWGLYTPNNAYVGGTLDLGSGASDDLTAGDVIDLTDGGTTALHAHAAGDATTLDGLNSTSFLRSDVADTAAGVITFTAAFTDIRGQLIDGDSTYLTIADDLYVNTGNIGIGITPQANRGLNLTLAYDSNYDVNGIRSEASNTNAASTAYVYGAYLLGNAVTAAGQTSSTGVVAIGTGAADGTGSRVGVRGIASGGNGTHAGVWGAAVESGDTGIHYGVYGQASGGSENWGLYTPDGAQLGDSISDTHVFWGTLKSGSMSDSHAIIPNTKNYGYIGTPANYWYRMYANTYYGVATTIQPTPAFKALDALDAMKVVEQTDEKSGRTSFIFSPESLPPMIKGDPSVDGEGADQFVDVFKALGFTFDSFRQMRQETRAGLTGVQQQIDARTIDPTTGNQAVAGNLSIQLDKDANDRARFSVFKDGGTDVAQELMRLDEEGNLHLKGALRPSALDLAEYHPLSGPATAGDVLVADRSRVGSMRRCETASDRAVVGIVSSEPGVVLGSGLSRIAAADPEMAEALDLARRRGDATEESRLWSELERRFSAGHAAIALSGTVPCKVDAAYGPIEVGDLLVASPTPGHAMRADDPRPGTVVAKALEPLNAGTGLIKVLVMLR